MQPHHSTIERRMRRQLANRLDSIMFSEACLVAVGVTLIAGPVILLVLTMLGLIPMSCWGL